jgi:hypothetical protein
MIASIFFILCQSCSELIKNCPLRAAIKVAMCCADSQGDRAERQERLAEKSAQRRIDLTGEPGIFFMKGD